MSSDQVNLMVAATNQMLRLWWRRGGRDRATLLSGFAVVALVLYLTLESLSRDTSVDQSPVVGGLSENPVLVDLTLVRNAKKKGAVCLDGSPPGYHLLRGFGSGSGSWLVHLEGGGWCNTVESCSKRSRTLLGSSHYFERRVPFYGILSHLPSLNPDFYNWNKVKVRYCDGASMSGDVDNAIQKNTTLFFRGNRIWKALMDELLSKGLANAKQALLTGCSAGGLSTFIHCDDFRALLPQQTTVKCLSDGGLFLDAKDVSGNRTIRSFYDDIVRLQDVAKNLLKECTSKMEPFQCFFPQEFVKHISTPLFIVNSAYDAWQVQHVLAPDASDPEGYWQRCKLNIHNCNSSQIETLQGFRKLLINFLSEFQQSKNHGGLFINSCFVHCQTNSNITWHSQGSPRINNRTIAEAVGDWYFVRRPAKEIDCAYPCNPSCYNLDLPQPYPGVK